MFIADPESKRVSTKNTPDDVKADRERARERERREFIRTAAVAIMSNLPLRLDLNQGETGLYAETAVARAKALWLEIQDEDC